MSVPHLLKNNTPRLLLGGTLSTRKESANATIINTKFPPISLNRTSGQPRLLLPGVSFSFGRTLALQHATIQPPRNNFNNFTVINRPIERNLPQEPKKFIPRGRQQLISNSPPNFFKLKRKTKQIPVSDDEPPILQKSPPSPPPKPKKPKKQEEEPKPRSPEKTFVPKIKNFEIIRKQSPKKDWKTASFNAMPSVHKILTESQTQTEQNDHLRRSTNVAVQDYEQSPSRRSISAQTFRSSIAEEKEVYYHQDKRQTRQRVEVFANQIRKDLTRETYVQTEPPIDERDRFNSIMKGAQYDKEKLRKSVFVFENSLEMQKHREMEREKQQEIEREKERALEREREIKRQKERNQSREAEKIFIYGKNKPQPQEEPKQPQNNQINELEKEWKETLTKITQNIFQKDKVNENNNRIQNEDVKKPISKVFYPEPDNEHQYNYNNRYNFQASVDNESTIPEKQMNDNLGNVSKPNMTMEEISALLGEIVVADKNPKKQDKIIQENEYENVSSSNLKETHFANTKKDAKIQLELKKFLAKKLDFTAKDTKKVSERMFLLGSPENKKINEIRNANLDNLQDEVQKRVSHANWTLNEMKRMRSEFEEAFKSNPELLQDGN